MHGDLADLRFRQLMASPGGSSLLIAMAHNGITPEEAVDPETSLHLVASTVGELNPWNPWHDRIVARLRQDAPQHVDLARALLAQPGIERWWAPLDRERQGWIEPEARWGFPAPDAFPTPDHPPTGFEHYVQWPEHHISTSTLVGAWSSQLTGILENQTSDWRLDYPARRKRVQISTEARVCEIVSAEDWHALVVRHGVRSEPGMIPHSSGRDQPWGENDGLIPDWQSIAHEWDGVHITLWAFLTGTQMRVTSGAGWTEMWSRDGEETTWLHWVFDEVEEMPPVGPCSVGQHYPLPFDYGGTRIVARRPDDGERRER